MRLTKFAKQNIKLQSICCMYPTIHLNLGGAFYSTVRQDKIASILRLFSRALFLNCPKNQFSQKFAVQIEFSPRERISPHLSTIRNQNERLGNPSAEVLDSNEQQPAGQSPTTLARAIIATGLLKRFRGHQLQRSQYLGYLGLIADPKSPSPGERSFLLLWRLQLQLTVLDNTFASFLMFHTK